ncbi:hypothetical protein M0802_008711 [Mischocyttarus mexicanus]|nr:hypothetical protein M0802_008711 [Mischocyttarus mexicanus]
MEILTGRIIYKIVLLLIVTHTSFSTRCNRMIDGTTRPRSPAEDKYSFFMTLYNRTDVVYAYMPDTKYTGPIPRKFTRFLISSEIESESEIVEIGTFDIMDDSISKFSDQCANAVIEVSKVPKERVSVAWTSPAEGSGCILIRATILETPDTWYMDDSNLVLNICQDTKAEADDQGPVLAECCACDEAKYEDFPSKGWLIRFSDVIGASHTVDYRFWRYNGYASIGLKQVAELGSTRQLESELKNQSEHIRTIIKARGISYPNVTGRTFAVFRVDRRHHLMSLVSMIDPSPDWIVGVSGLELCLNNNCTWVEHKELNLYPYDAGTDDGITYLSPNSPTDPQEPIRRITSSYPNDSRSPFYDPSGLDMKPLAKLYLNRQRLYEKTCNKTTTEITEQGSTNSQLRRFKSLQSKQLGENNGKNSGILGTEMCRLTDWSEWSSCTATCGQAVKSRSRNFQHKQYRKQCNYEQNGPDLEQNIECENEPCPDEDQDEVRNSLNDGDDENNENNENDVNDKNMEETDTNISYEGDEPGSEVNEEWLQKCPPEHYTLWSLWTPCSASCGIGVQLRTRKYKENLNRMEEDNPNLEECRQQQASCVADKKFCDFTREEAAEVCSEPRMEGNCTEHILRVYFNKYDGQCHHFKFTGCGGNRNNFPTKEYCYTVCGDYQKSLSEFKGLKAGSQVVESLEETSEKINCSTSKWSAWSPCINCRGFTISTRKIIEPARGGGKRCPKKMLRKKKCRKLPPCFSIDCIMTPQSRWSSWSGTCGNSSEYRLRSVKVQPRGPNGRLCSTVVEFRNCTTLECPVINLFTHLFV